MTEPQMEYRFIIDAFTPDTLPMSRLADYMAELAKLLGEASSVHFDRIERGSAVLVSHVEETVAAKVGRRVCDLGAGRGEDGARKAFRRLDHMLDEDAAVGLLVTGEGDEIIAFPGRERIKPLSYGPFNQDGTLDGVLLRVGGRGKTAHALIDTGDRVYSCLVSREQARELGPHIYGPVLRFHGQGRWRRDEEGRWHLERFRLGSFSILDDSPLSSVVARLRAVEGSGWKDVANPIGELREMRHDEEPQQ